MPGDLPSQSSCSVFFWIILKRDLLVMVSTFTEFMIIRLATLIPSLDINITCRAKLLNADWLR